MANVLRLTSGGVLIIDNVTDFVESTRTQDHTLTNALVVRNRQNISNSAHEALALGDISGNLGWGWFWNRDATNYVDIGRDISSAFQAFVRVKPGKYSGWIPFPPTVVPYAQANTAAVDLTYILITA